MKEEDRKNTILVIEDEPDHQELITGILEDAGYSTMTAGDGESGLAMAGQKRPDLIVLDLNLPDMDGVEVCRRLTSGGETSGVPVVVVTCRHALSSKLSTFMAGARRYVTKPFQIDGLLNEINCALRQTRIPGMPNGEIALDPRD